MKRRDFVKTAALFPGFVHFAGYFSTDSKFRRVPMIDGMGEIRLEYPISLISEVIKSGMTAVMITIGTPTLHGQDAYDEVVCELAAYEQHIRKHSDYFIKALNTKHIDEALLSEKLAFFLE